MASKIFFDHACGSLVGVKLSYVIIFVTSLFYCILAQIFEENKSICFPHVARTVLVWNRACCLPFDLPMTIWIPAGGHLLAGKKMNREK